MEITEAYKKSFWKIAAWAFGAIALVFSAYAFTSAGDGMVAYYCTYDNPLFIIHVSSWAACPFYVAFGYVVFFTIATLILIGVVVVTVDGSKILAIRTQRTFRRSFIEPRDAKLFFVAVPVEIEGKTEILVAIRNEELWLQADKVTVNSKFIDGRRREIDGDIKWGENGSQNNAISISRKKYKSLHFGTIDNDKFIIHFTDRDEEFPFPNTQNSYYVHPLYMSGSMSFLGYKLKRVILKTTTAILVYNNKEVKLRDRG